MMKSKLTEKETAVLQWIEMRANVTTSEIAKGIGLKEHSVRRIVESLLTQRLIHRYVHLNVYPLGYFEVGITVAFLNDSPEFVDSFIRWCQSQEKVCFLLEMTGRYHLKIGLTVRSMKEVHEFLEKASAHFDGPFARKDIVTLMELFDFGVHKSPDPRPSSVFWFGFGTSECELVSHDHEILKILSKHPELPPSAMARKLGLSLSTFNYRVARLEKAGVIAGYRYLFDPDGRTLDSFYGLVSLSGISEPARRAVYEFCRVHPQISYYAEVTGAYEFLFCMVVTRSAETLPIVREFKRRLSSLIKHVEIEVCAVPALRKLLKYPFN